MSGEPWDEEAEEARLRGMERDCAAAAAGELDYYAVLNLPRQASAENVREAYRRLSRIFHPDRHHDPERREWAQRQFHVVSRAHEVLTDPHTRAAYDRLGEEGIRVSKAVGHKVQTTRDLLDAFEHDARMRRIEEVEQWTRSKSEVAIHVDAAKAVSPLVRQVLRDSGMEQPVWGAAAVDRMLTKHSFSADLTNRLTGVVSGHMFSKGRIGTGNVIGTLKYAPGLHSSLSASVPVLPPYVITLKSMHQLSLSTFASTEIVQHTPNLATPPFATVTLGRLLFGTTTGVLTMRTGNQYAVGPFWAASPTRAPRATPSATDGRQVRREASGVTLGLMTDNEGKGRVYVEVAAGLEQSHAMARCERRLGPHFTVTGSLVLVAVGAPMPDEPRYDAHDAVSSAGDSSSASGLQGLGDVQVHVEILAAVDKWTKLEWKVDVGLSSGVMVTLGLHRMEHKISLPVLLSPLVELDVAGWAVVIPATVAFGLHYGVLKPRRRRLVQQRMRELEDEQRHHLYQQRRSAEEAVRLMAASVEHSRAAARAAN
ncbi:hypothetical protein H4R21_003802, partial [Coemansia helicoidea]